MIPSLFWLKVKGRYYPSTGNTVTREKKTKKMISHGFSKYLKFIFALNNTRKKNQLRFITTSLCVLTYIYIYIYIYIYMCLCECECVYVSVCEFVNQLVLSFN